MSRLTKQWLDSSIPSTPIDENAPQQTLFPPPGLYGFNGRPHQPTGEEKEIQERARQTRKQRRLAAFATNRLAWTPREKRSPLRPAEIVGMGRVAVNPKELTEIPLPTTRKKGKGRRGAKRLMLYGMEVKVDPSFVLPTSTKGESETSSQNPRGDPTKVDGQTPLAETDPIWPDTEYPWSLKDAERQEWIDEVQSERLKYVERFFDRETDGEDDEIVAEVAGTDAWDHSSELGDADGEKSGDADDWLGGGRRFLFSSDPSDARAALLSKRQVQAILYHGPPRSSSYGGEVDDGVIACVCSVGDDGRPMVRCDNCLTWYHQTCMDITDESQLDTEWFCWKCAPDSREGSVISEVGGNGSREPTFAPSSETPRPRLSDAVHLYQPISQSPLIALSQTGAMGSEASVGSSSGTGAAYRTPLGKADGNRGDVSAHSIRGTRPRGGFFSRGGDSVGPYSSKFLYTPGVLGSDFHPNFSTPKYFDYASHSDVVEPRSTPSRAVNLGTPASFPIAGADIGGIMATPKSTQTLSWAMANLLPTPLTPVNQNSKAHPNNSKGISASDSGRPGLGYSSGTTADSGGPSSPLNPSDPLPDVVDGVECDAGVGRHRPRKRQELDERHRTPPFLPPPPQLQSPLHSKYPLSAYYASAIGPKVTSTKAKEVRTDDCM